MNAIQQILFNTPLWVWAILAFLVYRGILASLDRETSLKKLFIIPFVMLVLSLQGIASAFGTGSTAMLSWLAAAVVGGALSWQLFKPDSVRPDPQRQVVFQRGSWVPFMLMMGIFFTKYVVSVTLALHADYKQDVLFVAAVCSLYGLFNGVFLGKLLGILAAYRRAQTPPQWANAI